MSRLNMGTIWLVDKPNETNKVLLRSVSSMLKSINLRAGIKLDIKIINDKDKKMLAKKANKIPCMKLDAKYYSGSEDILDALRKKIHAAREPVKLKNEEEDVHDWSLKCLQLELKEGIPSADENNDGNKFAAMAMDIAKKRKEASASSQVPITDIVGPKSVNLSEDDDLLSVLLTKAD